MLATNSSFADEQKREAVIALASRKAPAQEVADAVGVTRAVLGNVKFFAHFES